MPPKGLRDGELSKPELVERLSSRFQHAKKYFTEASKAALVGMAIHHGLLNQQQCVMSIPYEETTVPAYLRSRIPDDKLRASMDAYVTAWSRLFVRGSWLANRVIMRAVDVAQLPRRWNAREMSPIADDVASFILDTERVKQCFLPEFWPTADVPRDAAVAAALDVAGTQHLLPDYMAVMARTGWNQAINEMGRQYVGNFKTHVKANIVKHAKAYVSGVVEATKACGDALDNGLRPLEITQDDFDLVANVRAALGCTKVHSTLGDVPVTPDLVGLHVFLLRSGAVTGRSYAPVAQTGRHYAYIDERIACYLMQVPEARCPHGAPESASTPLQHLLHLLPSDFSRTTREARRLRRRALRRARVDAAGKQRRRGRGRGIAPRRSTCGGRNPDDVVAVSSIRTDGVGLRVCVKTPIDIRKYIRPAPTPEEIDAWEAARGAADDQRANASLARKASPRHPDAAVAAAAISRDAADAAVNGLDQALKAAASDAERKPLRKALREARAALTAAKGEVSRAMQAFRNSLVAPAPERRSIGRDDVFIALDNGLVKPYVAAITTDPTKPPETLVFTRRRHRHDMGYFAFRRWEQRRLAQRADVRTALVELSQSGGTRNVDTVRWEAYMQAHSSNATCLLSEYESAERALWRMRMFRRGRSSLDRAVDRLFERAKGNRHVILGVGDAKFPSSMPGSMSSPTVALQAAIHRGVARRQGRTTVTSLPENRTTLCCCACGQETTQPRVRDPRTGEERPSRRLRLCTSCDPTTPKRRDRDVNAARNLLWVLQYWYIGTTRPTYLDTWRVREEDAALA